jgi:GNAT superfamily N-acetyltransferase
MPSAPPTPKRWLVRPEDWTRRLDAPDRATFVAESDNGSWIGLAVGAPDRDQSTAAFLLSMWVVPEARGQGAADSLVQAVVRWARDQGYKVLELHVTQGNNAAETLYRRNGFYHSGNSFIRDRDGLAELEMIVDLAELDSRLPNRPEPHSAWACP